VFSACRIFSEGLEFVENFLEHLESNLTPKKKKKKGKRGKGGGQKRHHKGKKSPLPGFLIIAHHLRAFLV